MTSIDTVAPRVTRAGAAPTEVVNPPVVSGAADASETGTTATAATNSAHHTQQQGASDADGLGHGGSSDLPPVTGL